MIRVETIGADEKYWLAQPGSENCWLFKANNVHKVGGRTWSQREDFSEKVSGELALKMEIPSARIELAEREGENGCVSLNLCPLGWELQPGVVLMDGLLVDYVPGYEQGNRTRAGHSLENIHRALADYGPPPGAAVPDWFNAFDVFVGYVTFDAIIANRDRHDENWAVVRPPSGELPGALAGSFDHARALGSTLVEGRMAGLLEAGKIAAWVERGTAWRFEHDPTRGCPTLVEAARLALSMVNSEVRDHWLDRVMHITSTDVGEITRRVPGMSEVVSTFIEQVVMANRRRVLDGC
ncbi:hypothetical protein ABNF97_28290 [Plantactinospora sp. B6F1]|uniref:hypothetical protein n=1 Tax=Plantactinospora sp. B6F1 TaxID=3158971 RepID=UPI0032D984A0